MVVLLADSMPTPGQWTAWVRHAVDTFGDRVKYWQIWNEPDGFPLPGNVLMTKEAYEDTLLDPAAPIIRNGNGRPLHAGRVVAGSIITTYNLAWFDQIKGASVDLYAMHIYSSDPASFVHAISVTNAWIDANDPGKELWITEFNRPGPETDSSGVEQEISAMFSLLAGHQYHTLTKAFFLSSHHYAGSLMTHTAGFAPTTRFNAYYRYAVGCGGRGSSRYCGR